MIKKRETINTLVISAGGPGHRISKYFKSIGFKDPKFLFPIKDGQSTLDYIIKLGLKCNFKKIFILTKTKKASVKKYIWGRYKNKNIKILETNEKNKFGIGYEMYKFRKKFGKYFIFSDGDVLFKKNALTKLKKHGLNKSLMTITASPIDKASTHLEIAGKDLSKVKYVVSRLGPKNKHYYHGLKIYCGIGLMSFDSAIFDLFKDFKQIMDLDILAEKLFKDCQNDNPNLVKFIEYDKWWLAFHSEADLKDKGLKSEKLI